MKYCFDNLHSCLYATNFVLPFLSYTHCAHESKMFRLCSIQVFMFSLGSVHLDHHNTIIIDMHTCIFVTIFIQTYTYARTHLLNVRNLKYIILNIHTHICIDLYSIIFFVLRLRNPLKKYKCTNFMQFYIWIHVTR